MKVFAQIIFAGGVAAALAGTAWAAEEATIRARLLGK